MSQVRQSWKDAWSMHRSERRGFILLVMACMVAAAWVTYEQWLKPAEAGPPVVLTAELEPWYEAQVVERDSAGAGRAPHTRVALFPFDPNGLPLEQWMALGLSERQAAAIHKYEAGGGRFRSKADVERMRVVDSDLYQRWEPFIQLPDSAAPRQQRAPWSFGDGGGHAERSAPRTVEVNSADSAALVAVPGIGPAFARGILKYRDKLGGYHSLDQLAEVYVLKDKPDAVDRLRERLTFDTLLLRRISVNTATAEQLAAHPYLDWKVAKALVAYRTQHGVFREVADIQGCVLVSDSLFRKLAPYLQAP
jgi:DNA uptake protein ComE-like DNA-binding protein